MRNPWFRFYAEFEDDPKVQMMPEPMQRRLAMLFCEKCKGESRTEVERAFKWGITVLDLAATKVRFLEAGFIDQDWNVVNWRKRQFLSDSSSDRVRRHREKLKRLKHDETEGAFQGVTDATVGATLHSVSSPVDNSETAGLVKRDETTTDTDADANTEEEQKQNPSRTDGASAEQVTPETPEAPKRKRTKAEKPKSADGMKHSTDPRHIACKAEIEKYWKTANPDDEMPWDGSEGKALAMLLKASPDLTPERMHKLLGHRYLSEDVAHSDRPSKWVRSIHSYARGPLDRFGRPMGGKKRDTANGHTAKSEQAVANLQAALRRGGADHGGADGAGDPAGSGAGTGISGSDGPATIEGTFAAGAPSVAADWAP